MEKPTYIPVLINNCVFPSKVCSHFIANSSVNAQKLLKMTIKATKSSKPKLEISISNRKFSLVGTAIMLVPGIFPFITIGDGFIHHRRIVTASLEEN
ncbi:MAG: hypothetical protein KDK54_21710 [Leptospiraceae bacterium]|nr:hypothetical protein [Leptospiraceae bacterium]